MWAYIWPVLVAIVTNTLYHVATKETPQGVSPFLSLTATYVTGAVASFLAFLLTTRGQHVFLQQVKELNWASFALGVIVMGLEFGYICIYRAGWNISIASLVCNICMAVALIAIGLLFYQESISTKQIVGICICAVGLVLINAK